MRSVIYCLAPALLGGCNAGTIPVKATVISIDRTCEYIRQNAERTRYEEPCSSTPEFRGVADRGVPSGERLVGHETVHLSWTAPHDGSAHFGELHFTGRDDEFYTINAGDQLPLRIKQDDPSQFRRA